MGGFPKYNLGNAVTRDIIFKVSRNYIEYTQTLLIGAFSPVHFRRVPKIEVVFFRRFLYTFITLQMFCFTFLE